MVELATQSGLRIHQAAKGGLTPLDAPSQETTFRYKYLWAFCAWTIAIDGLVVIGVIRLILLGRPADAAFFGLIFLVGVSIIGCFLVASQADVVVSDTGVSRRLWGRTLREIPWGNIKKIRVFRMYHRGYRRKVRVFHIFPVRPPRLRLSPSGKISFDEPGDLSDLIGRMNRHIAARRIPIEVQVGVNWSDPASWSIRTAIDLTAETSP